MSETIKKAIFPVAGLGTRFLPATKALPKEMMPIVDKPMIQYGIEEALACHIKQFIVVTGKQKRAIEDHFDCAFELEEKLRKSGKKRLLEEIKKLNEINIAYIRQGYPLGLGHAILCTKPFVKDEAFAVILSDDIIPPEDTLLKDMMKLHKKVAAPILALQRVPKTEIHRYGVIDGIEEEDGIYRIKKLVEKPEPEEAPSDLAIIGRYILTPDIFEILEKSEPGKGDEIQLTDALNKLLKKRPVYGYVLKGKRYDAGDKFGYLKAIVEFALKDPKLSKQFKSYLHDLTDGQHKKTE